MKTNILFFTAVIASASVGYFVGHQQGRGDIDASTQEPKQSDGAAESVSSNDVEAPYTITADLDLSNRSFLSEFSWINSDTPFTAQHWAELRAKALSIPLDQIMESLNDLKNLPVSKEREELKYELIVRLVAIDPDTAMDLAKGLGLDSVRWDAIKDSLRIWASNDPMLALSWFDDQVENDGLTSRETHKLIDNVIRGYADYSIDDAINYFNANLDSFDRKQRNKIAEQLVLAILQQGLTSQSFDYISRLPEDESRDRAYRDIIRQLTALDVSSGMALLQSAEGSEHYGELQQSFVRQWARSHSANAAEYVAQIDVNDPGFSTMAAHVINYWRDNEAASEWLLQYEPSPTLDAASYELVNNVRYVDPESAATWALSITDEKMRMRALRNVARSWTRVDVSGLEVFISETNEFTDQERVMMAKESAKYR